MYTKLCQLLLLNQAMTDITLTDALTAHVLT